MTVHQAPGAAPGEPDAGPPSATPADAALVKARFLSHVGHELRTPLNAVLGFAQLMRSDIEADDTDRSTQLKQLGFVEQAGWQLLTMVDSLLELARIETGRLELDIQPSAVGPILDEAAATVAAQAEARGIAVEAICEPGLVVRADAARLRQCLARLAGNGVDYNHDGGRVTLRACADGDEVRFTVADSGRGMAPEQVDHLFDPFARPGGNARVDGAGMSLPIVRGVVALMRGRIAVDSQPGRGTVVTLLLPR